MSGTGDSRIDDALAALRRLPWPDCADALETIAAIDSPEADRALLQLLDHRSSRVREEALERCAARAPWLARLAARAMLSDNDSGVRSSAARDLYPVANSRDRYRLIAVLSSASDWLERAFAADALTDIKGKAVRDTLLDALHSDPEPIVRRDAASALAFGKHGDIIPELEQALAAEKEDQALVGLLGGLYLLGQRERLPALLALLRSPERSVRYSAMNMAVGAAHPGDKATILDALDALIVVETNPGLRTDAAKTRAELSGEAASR